MIYLDRPMEIKALNDAGTFEGYASMFGNIDQGGDIVERGAFKEVVTNKAGKVTVLWQHRADQPIAVADVKEDDTGLWFQGALVLEDPSARKAHAHMKAGSVTGMSIGYDVLAGGTELLNSGVRKLTALKLWEISLVTWGMNPLAGVTDVKTAAGCKTIREFETWLRDAGRFSSADAKAIASGGWKAYASARDEPAAADLALRLAGLVDGIRFDFSTCKE